MEKGTKTALGIAGAVALTMAAAATAYLYVGENAPERRRKLAAWMADAEREIVNEAKKLKDIAFSEENYRQIVEAVAEKYRIARNLDPQVISEFVALMSENWEEAARKVREEQKAPRSRIAKRTTGTRKRKA